MFAITRDLPDTALAAVFDGEPLVQSFSVALPDGVTGRVWITTAEAYLIPGFGRPWVEGRLAALSAEVGAEALARELAAGLRLRAQAPAALALAA